MVETFEDRYDFIYNPTGDIPVCKECGVEVPETSMVLHAVWHDRLNGKTTVYASRTPHNTTFYY